MIEDIAKPKQLKPEKARNKDNWKIELKYDGTRQFLIQKETSTELYNKRGTQKTRHFPDITKQLTLPQGTVLDGETIITDHLHPHGNKNLLQTRDGGKPVIRKSGRKNFKQKHKMNQHPATFVAFDLLRYKGENYRNKNIEERRSKLKEIVQNSKSNLKISERFDSFTQAWSEVLSNQLEGVVVKQPFTQYPEGRTRKWHKVKNIKDTVVTITGYEQHSKGITAKAEDGGHRVTVNGAVSKKVKEKLESEGQVEAEVSYLEETENGSLREPRFKRLKK